ncbi:hypothetical protein [Oligoflexus sp.]|uniref:hypothetical protein n=1 Tax=Oligoflexus sp. TaxID=1971216 RepID=UPI002D79D535|nr:hypothetical protein [Oligoflexus sp.]
MNSTASKLEGVFLGQDAIKFLIEELGVREAMIAGMLDVTTRTLENWKHDNVFAVKAGKIARLRAFYEAVVEAQKADVPASAILNLLNEPIPELQAEGCSTILHVIVESPDNRLIKPFVTRLAKEYV